MDVTVPFRQKLTLSADTVSDGHLNFCRKGECLHCTRYRRKEVISLDPISSLFSLNLFATVALCVKESVFSLWSWIKTQMNLILPKLRVWSFHRIFLMKEFLNSNVNFIYDVASCSLITRCERPLARRVSIGLWVWAASIYLLSCVRKLSGPKQLQNHHCIRVMQLEYNAYDFLSIECNASPTN